jgi:membrane protein YqaA with SNARE-associated domain
VQSVLDSLDAFGGIYVALFLFAMLSGVFIVANAEAAVIALGAASSYGMPKLIVLAVIVALGQCVTHALVYQSGRGLAKLGARGRPRLEARIARVRALGEKWKRSELLLIAVGAVLGFPPQFLIALLAGMIGIRFRTFMLIDIAGRIVRFIAIVTIAHAV